MILDFTYDVFAYFCSSSLFNTFFFVIFGLAILSTLFFLIIYIIKGY